MSVVENDMVRRGTLLSIGAAGVATVLCSPIPIVGLVVSVVAIGVALILGHRQSGTIRRAARIVLTCAVAVCVIHVACLVFLTPVYHETTPGAGVEVPAVVDVSPPTQ